MLLNSKVRVIALILISSITLTGCGSKSRVSYNPNSTLEKSDITAISVCIRQEDIPVILENVDRKDDVAIKKAFAI